MASQLHELTRWRELSDADAVAPRPKEQLTGPYLTSFCTLLTQLLRSAVAAIRDGAEGRATGLRSVPPILRTGILLYYWHSSYEARSVGSSLLQALQAYLDTALSSLEGLREDCGPIAAVLHEVYVHDDKLFHAGNLTCRYSDGLVACWWVAWGTGT